MSKVFVVDPNKQQLDPVHPGQARILLNTGKAAIYRKFPFTIILKSVVQDKQVAELRVKLDPGSKATGIAIVNDTTGEVVFAAELLHRGQTIKKRLDKRRGVRRGRHYRHMRYREPRFDNRPRRKGWLPPSLESRIANVLTWVRRFAHVCHITAMSMELVKFDLQLMENPEVSGVQYQQGTLAGYELREYLLEKWKRTCAYCGKQHIPLQIEHIVARAKGGSNRVSNLCLACPNCNTAKGTKDIKDFLKKKPELLKNILAQAKAPLKDAAAVNATRWELYRKLQALGLPIECGTGGRTKYNRTMPKTHWLDASCIGTSTPEQIQATGVVPLLIKASGHGCRQKRNVDEYGFPHGKAKGAKRVKGFQTGDMVKAIVPSGRKNAGTHIGRIAIRAKGYFNITTRSGLVPDVGYQYCRALHQLDGYSYQKGEAAFLPIP